MDTIAAWAAQLQWDVLLDLFVTAAAAMLCITFHEIFNGLAALAMGDPTAKRMGRLSLNPLKHIDLVGFAMMVVARFGWAKPVPINPGYFKRPKLGMALTALAGPVSNVFLSALAAFGYTVSIFYALWLENAALEWIGEFFYLVFYLSAGLAVFNLLPVPPLDGSKVLFALLPEPLYWKLMRYERYGMLVMMALLLTGALDIPLHFLRDGLIDLLAPISGWTLDLLTAIHR